MASLNRVLLIGNLTRDPELRYIPSGTAVCEFGLAINREYKGKDGGKKEDTCFVDITVWGRQGETCNQYLNKGRSVFVEGRLDYSQWESREGEKRSKLRVVADRVQFLSSGQGGGGGGDRGKARGGQERVSAPAAAGRSDPGPGQVADDLNLDDIPF